METDRTQNVVTVRLEPLEWSRLEEVVERAVRKARSEELEDVAEALKAVAEHMKAGFEATNKVLEGVIKAIDELRNAVDEMHKALDERLKRLEVTVGHLGGRWGRGLERTVLELFKEALERRGIESQKVERLELRTDTGDVVEIDVYIHDKKAYLIEVKAMAYSDDVGWFAWRARLAAEELAKRGKEVERLILVAVHIERNALERAKRQGIDVIYGNVIE